MRFKFQLEVGFAVRNSVRNDLESTKSTLEWKYPGSELVIRESIKMNNIFIKYAILINGPMNFVHI